VKCSHQLPEERLRGCRKVAGFLGGVHSGDSLCHRWVSYRTWFAVGTGEAGRQMVGKTSWLTRNPG